MIIYKYKINGTARGKLWEHEGEVGVRFSPNPVEATKQAMEQSLNTLRQAKAKGPYRCYKIQIEEAGVT